MTTDRIPISRVPEIVKASTGHAPDVRTVRRWATVGFKGRVLRTAQFGRERFTTQEWLDEFTGEHGPEEKSQPDESRISEALASLESLGIRMK